MKKPKKETSEKKLKKELEKVREDLLKQIEETNKWRTKYSQTLEARLDNALEIIEDLGAESRKQKMDLEDFREDVRSFGVNR